MNNCRIAICDDSKYHAEMIFNTINLVIERNKLNCLLESYNSGEELSLQHKKKHFDIVFLDVEMPEQNGIDLGLCIKEIDEATKIIYVTAHKGYAFDSYKVKAEEYLLKPAKYLNVEQAILTCLDMLKTKKQRKFLDVRDISRNFQRIYIDNIIYIKRNKDRKIHINCIYKKTVIINETVENIEKKFADCNNIVKANQSCLVNLNNTVKLSKDILTFCDNTTIKASESRLPFIRKEFYKNL